MKCDFCRWWTRDPDSPASLSWYCLLWWFVMESVSDIRDCCYWEVTSEVE